MPILTNLANLLIVPGAVLLLPIAVTLCFRWVALRADEAKQKLIWAGYRSFGRFILAVGVVSKIGTGFLRRAEGLKFNTLKSGEYRSRALRVARGMDVTLRRVFVVPAGKGHLTNAYGMSNAIALTDNLGKYLTKSQLEFVMAHELAHVKLKHVRKYFLLALAVFLITALLLF